MRRGGGHQVTSAAAAARSHAADGRVPAPRVLVVEDHRTVAQSLVLVLRGAGLDADAVAGPPFDDVVQQAASYEPDVVLLDLDLGPGGTQGTSLVGPLGRQGAAVVMLSGVRDRRQLAECVEAGAVGVLDKAEPVENVVAAVRAAVAAGRLMSDHERFEWLAELRAARAEREARLAPFEQLTPREQDVLVRLGEGLSAAEIGEAQFVSVFTVRGHIRSILVKLGVGSQLAAVALARRAGWLP